MLEVIHLVRLAVDLTPYHFKVILQFLQMFIHFLHFGVDCALIRISAHVIRKLLGIALGASDAILEPGWSHSRTLTTHTNKPAVIAASSRLHSTSHS